MPEISAKLYTQETTSVEKGSWSRFLITINTNQKFVQDDIRAPLAQAYLRKLGMVLNVMFTEKIQKYILMGSWDPEKKGKKTITDFRVAPDQGGIWERLVHLVDSSTALEIGPNTGAAHAHTLLRIRHETCITFDKDTFKKDFCKYMDLTGAYINIRTVNGVDSVEEYLLKGHKEAYDQTRKLGIGKKIDFD